LKLCFGGLSPPNPPVATRLQQAAVRE